MSFRQEDNNPMRRPTPLRERFYHQNGFNHLGDSFEGIDYAKSLGFDWVDTNHQTTGPEQGYPDGCPVCMHWGRPMMHGWRDPLRKMRRWKRVRNMTLAEFRRLRPKAGTPMHTPHTSDEILHHCAQVGIGTEFEGKNGLFTPFLMMALDDAATRYKTRVHYKTISNLGGKKAARERLVLAHRYTTWSTTVLPRGLKRVPRSWWPFIDHVRGRVRWTGTTAKEAIK